MVLERYDVILLGFLSIFLTASFVSLFHHGYDGRKDYAIGNEPISAIRCFRNLSYSRKKTALLVSVLH